MAHTTTISNAPPFLPKSLSKDKLLIAPTQVNDIGTYVVGVKQVRNSGSFFRSFIIVVAQKLQEINPEITPYFYPKLKDSSKVWSKKYSHTLPSIVDPYNMFVHINKVFMKPERAQVFLKVI